MILFVRSRVLLQVATDPLASSAEACMMGCILHTQTCLVVYLLPFSEKGICSLIFFFLPSLQTSEKCGVMRQFPLESSFRSNPGKHKMGVNYGGEIAHAEFYLSQEIAGHVPNSIKCQRGRAWGS